MKHVIKVAVTGGAGQIAYSLLPRIASGSMFGADQPVELHLIEIPAALAPLESVVMELHDCAISAPAKSRRDLRPRRRFSRRELGVAGGQRSSQNGNGAQDLLGINGKIFTLQGEAIARNAASDVRALVVGNPCNTNCLIAMNSARDVPKNRWFAMTRLDENRAKAQLALKLGTHWRDVTRLTIWGNHSSTLYPDFFNARIGGTPAAEVIADRTWLERDFIELVQQRGAAIEARGLSSAKSAAHGVIGTVRSLIEPAQREIGTASLSVRMEAMESNRGIFPPITVFRTYACRASLNELIPDAAHRLEERLSARAFEL